MSASEWLSDNLGEITDLVGWHLWLSVLPLVIGLAAALPLGWLAHRSRGLYPLLVALAGLVYTVPSLALFILLPKVLGTRILDPVNVVVALSVYTVALMMRVVADGLAAVPAEAVQSAHAMGYLPRQRLLRIELPIAVPVITAGLRVAAVSNVSLVSMAALLGVPQLGTLFTQGFQLHFYTPIVTGVVLSLVIALLLDGLILLAGHALTPWQPERTAR
ncbi:ABC transporter permease subunit [Streptomyces sp. NPDC048385]|uniref:ABC transporter permease n=1 Tax=Streptomyces sp. NPDC048385 TaxID=3155145 RepID=UPI00343B6A82